MPPHLRASVEASPASTHGDVQVEGRAYTAGAAILGQGADAAGLFYVAQAEGRAELGEGQAFTSHHDF